MATKKGWKIDQSRSIAGTYEADVSEGQVMKWGTGGEGYFAVCGAGEVPCGVAPETLDISEDGADGNVVRSQIAVTTCAAAVTSLTVPVKVAASGTVTPAVTGTQIILGMPLNTQSTVGGEVQVDLTLMGAQHTI